MKVVALISGGKDSTYNMMECVAEGHEITALANLRPKDKDELDSYMFQTVGHHAIDLYAQAMELPLYRRTLQGESLSQGADYTMTENDEVEDLYELLKEVKEAENIEGVSVGAILSDYQRVRVENVCRRLGLTPLAYLWRRDQMELLEQMTRSGLEAILIKVAALGLKPRVHLGKTLSQIYPHMVNMKEKFGLNVCGEGGEYETFTLDSPLFKQRIVIDETKMIMHSECDCAPVAYLNILKAHLEVKDRVDYRDRTSQHGSCLTSRNNNLLAELFPDGTPQDIPLSEETDNTPCVQCTLQRLEGNCIQVQRSASNHVWVTGVTGFRREDSSRQSVQAVTKDAMDLLNEKLKDEGLSMTDLITVHMYVQDMADYAQMNQIYCTYFTVNPPARVCVEAALPANVLLRLECLAYKASPPGVSIDGLLARRTMHVQGLSHWAPANIGPYSQAVKLGETIYVAGQIGMVPTHLDLIPSFKPQCRLSLRHLRRILVAMEPTCNLLQIVYGVCYVTRAAYLTYAEAELLEQLKELQDAESGSWENSASMVPMMEYVVVPMLPKGALVEWQVYADSCKDQINEVEMRKSGGDLSSWLQCRVLPAPDGLISFIIRIDDKNTCATLSTAGYVKEMLELAVLTLEGALHQLSESRPHIVQCLRAVRVFYRQDLFDENNILSEYADICQRNFNLPAPILVPVECFMSSTQVMSWCS